MSWSYPTTLAFYHCWNDRIEGNLSKMLSIDTLNETTDASDSGDQRISFLFYVFLLQEMQLCNDELYFSECWSAHWKLYIDMSFKYSQSKEDAFFFFVIQCIDKLSSYLGKLAWAENTGKILEFLLDCRRFLGGNKILSPTLNLPEKLWENIWDW